MNRVNMADSFDLFKRLSAGASFSQKRSQNGSQKLKVSLNLVLLVKYTTDLLEP